MKMTKVDALNVALSVLTADSYEVQYDAVFADGTSTIHTETYTRQEVREVIEKMIAQLEKPRAPMTEEAKQKVNAARKAKNAQKRAELVAEIMPKLFAVMGTDEDSAQTARSIFESAELPADMTVGKVQAMLLKNADVVVIDNGRNAKTYFRKLA